MTWELTPRRHGEHGGSYTTENAEDAEKIQKNGNYSGIVIPNGGSAVNSWKERGKDGTFWQQKTKQSEYSAS